MDVPHAVTSQKSLDSLQGGHFSENTFPAARIIGLFFFGGGGWGWGIGLQIKDGSVINTSLWKNSEDFIYVK